MLIEGFKGRTVSTGDKVRIYRNLNNKKWSVRAMNGEFKNKVVAHLDTVTLVDAKFIVSEASRQRVCTEKRKNVHAYAQGIIESFSAIEATECSDFITYDPYRSGFFCHEDALDNTIDEAAQLNFIPHRVFI